MPRLPLKSLDVADQIGDLITGGPYRARTWLPSERELGEKFDADRSTIRRALADLVNRSLIKKYPGRGYKVTARQTDIIISAEDILGGMGGWRGFPASVARAGREPFNNITSAGEVPASTDVASRLLLPVGALVYERTRVQGEVIDGRQVPLQLSWSWYTVDLADAVPAIRATPRTGPSPIRATVEQAGYRVRYDVLTRFRFADRAEREALELAGDPAGVAEVWRTCVDVNAGRPIEVTRLVLDASRVRLAYSYSPAVA